MQRFLVTGLCALLLAAPASAQTTGALAGNGLSSSESAQVPLRATASGSSRTSLRAVIHGNALNSTNGAMANSPVRLRDARAGRIVELQITDRAGLFEFADVEPGSYVIELLGDDQTVLAASELLHVNAGDAMTTIVKLPLRVPPAGLMSGSAAQTAVALVSAAAASGVLASTVVGVDATPQVP